MSENKEVIAQENEHQTREYGDEEVAPHLHTKTYLVLLVRPIVLCSRMLMLTATSPCFFSALLESCS